MKDKKMMSRPTTSRGRHDQRNKRGNKNSQRNRNNHEKIQNAFPVGGTPRSNIGPLKLQAARRPSQGLMNVPALKDMYGRQTNPTVKGHHSASAKNPLAQAKQCQENGSGNIITTITNNVRDFFVTKVSGGSKRPSHASERQSNSKKKKRTYQQDSLAKATSPDQRPQLDSKRRKFRQAPREANVTKNDKNFIVLLADDSDTEDEGSFKKPQQIETSSNRKSRTSKSLESRPHTVEEEQPKSKLDVYGKLRAVGVQADYVLEQGKSPSSQSPTKHGLCSSDSSSSGNTTQPGEGYFRKSRAHKRQITNIADDDDDDDDDDNNERQATPPPNHGTDEWIDKDDDCDSDGESFSTYMPTDAPVRRSKSTPTLQKAQNAAKNRRNADMEEMANPSCHRKWEKFYSSPSITKPSAKKEEICLLNDDDNGDQLQNHETNTNKKSTNAGLHTSKLNSNYAAPLNHPGMNIRPFVSSKSKTGGSSDLPADLQSGATDATRVSQLLKNWDNKKNEFKQTPKDKTEASDEENDCWAVVTTTNSQKASKENFRSPESDQEESRIARKLVERCDFADWDDDGGKSMLRTQTKEKLLAQSNALLEDNPDATARLEHNRKFKNGDNYGKIPRKSSRKSTPIIPGASMILSTRARSSQNLSPYFSRQSRSEDDSSRRKRNDRLAKNNYYHGDYDKIQEQESLLASARKRITRERKAKKKKPATNEDEPIVLSSDSEAEDRGEVKDIEYDLRRIAVGKLVSSSGCRLTYNPNLKELILTFQRRPKRNTRSSLSSGLKIERAFFRLHGDSLKAFKLFKRTEIYTDEDSADFNFVAFQIDPKSSGNNLGNYPNYYKPYAGASPKTQYIVLDFRTDDDFEDFCSTMVPILAKFFPPGTIEHNETTLYAQTLIDDSRKVVSSRIAQKNHSAFVQGRDSEAVLLVYPFAGDPIQIEAAAEGLQEPSGKLSTKSGYISDSSDDEQDTVDQDTSGKPMPSSKDSSEEKAVAKVKVRQHYVTIRVKDYERLHPEEWLNDSLVDFWMQWISRSENKSTSKLHFFTSHFYSAVSKRNGPESVVSWTAKKNINIFEKKFIFIPINKDLHWSLCVVVNPGCIKNSYEHDVEQKSRMDVSCLIFLDSLSMHREMTIRKKIENWLNSEWSRIHPKDKIAKPFAKDRFEIFKPRVPRQNNSWDCGVFVCRYAFAIFKLRKESFTFEGLHGSSPFAKLVTGGAEFDFNMSDIVRFRGEVQMLIENLSRVYMKWQRGREKKIEEGDDKEKKIDKRTNDEGDENEEVPMVPTSDQSTALLNPSCANLGDAPATFVADNETVLPNVEEEYVAAPDQNESFGEDSESADGMNPFGVPYIGDTCADV